MFFFFCSSLIPLPYHIYHTPYEYEILEIYYRYLTDRGAGGSFNVMKQPMYKKKEYWQAFLASSISSHHSDYVMFSLSFSLSRLS